MFTLSNCKLAVTSAPRPASSSVSHAVLAASRPSEALPANPGSPKNSAYICYITLTKAPSQGVNSLNDNALSLAKHHYQTTSSSNAAKSKNQDQMSRACACPAVHVVYMCVAVAVNHGSHMFDEDADTRADTGDKPSKKPFLPLAVSEQAGVCQQAVPRNDLVPQNAQPVGTLVCTQTPAASRDMSILASTDELAVHFLRHHHCLCPAVAQLQHFDKS